MSKISLVIFDLDDTLIHSNIDYALMKQKVKNLFDPNYKFKNNPTIKELLEILTSDQQKFQQAYTILNQMESESASKAELIPYADKIPLLVKELHINSAILTNNSKASVNTYLKDEKFKFLNDMGPIITRDDVPSMKPDPAGLNKIVQLFNLQNNRDQVFFIGDSYIDSDACLQAGIKFILINSRNLDLNLFKNPPWKNLNQLTELPELLRNIMIDCVY